MIDFLGSLAFTLISWAFILLVANIIYNGIEKLNRKKNVGSLLDSKIRYIPMLIAFTIALLTWKAVWNGAEELFPDQAWFKTVKYWHDNAHFFGDT